MYNNNRFRRGLFREMLKSLDLVRNMPSLAARAY